MDNEEVAAGATLHGFGDGEDGIGGNGGVDRGTAVVEDLGGGLGGENLAGGGDALAGDDHGAAVVAACAVGGHWSLRRGW